MSTGKPSNRLLRGSRQQPPMSCQSCRSRKLRCDRDNPCANCTSRGIPCQRAQTTTATRPPSSLSPSASTQLLLKRLEAIENVISLQPERVNQCQANQDQPATLPNLMRAPLTPSILSTPSSFPNNSVSTGSPLWHYRQDVDSQISTHKSALPFPSSTGWLYRKRNDVSS